MVTRSIPRSMVRGLRVGAVAATLTLLCCKATPTDGSSPAAARPAGNAPAGTPSSGITSRDKAAPGATLNLMPSASLAGFRRVPISPLADKPVWQVSSGGELLSIDGAGAKEMLLYETELGDGVLHVEWRFVPNSAVAGSAAAGSVQPASVAAAGGATAGSAVPGTAKPAEEPPAYNGGVYVRTPLDGKSWVQLQVAHADKAPVVGDLIAQVPSSTERINVFQSEPSPARPIGEWNVFDITARGPRIELAVNGKPTVTWPECPMPRGHVGLQAEGARIEVRKFEFTPL